MMFRIASALALALAVLPSSRALADAPPSASPCGGPAVSAAAATYEGTIRSVDFQASNALVCLVTSAAVLPILVTPGTLVQAGENAGKSGGYRAMTDLKAGERAKMITSSSGGRLTATIVILQK